MESYEEFCLRSLVVLQEERKLKRKTCEPLCFLTGGSVIHFYGRAVLSPLLSAEQRVEMCGHRQRAIQLELEQQNQQRNTLLARVQSLLDQAQACEAPRKEDFKLPVCNSATVGGYTLVTDSPGLPKDPPFRPQGDKQPVISNSETLIFNGYKEDVKTEKQDRSEEEEEDEDISLDSLLKRSREYVKREQSQQGLEASQTPSPQTVCAKEQQSCSPIRDTGVEFGFSLHHSPVRPPPIQHQPLFDPSPQNPGVLLPSKTERYACLPSPEFCISSCPRRRKPRPVSTGNIHISFPIDPADLIPRSPGRSGEGAGVEDYGGVVLMSSSQWSSDSKDSGFRTGNRRSSYCSISPVQETKSPVSASVPSSMAHYDHLALGFRRRCHTLDNQLSAYQSEADYIDRSQERVPRFMAGVTWLGPGRRTAAAPSNQSYEVENTSPLLRPHIAPDDPQRQNGGVKTPTVQRKIDGTQSSKTEEFQWLPQALEEMQRRLEEEHALQMSLLLAEQEKEQQRLRLELEETERRLKEQESGRCVGRDSCGRSCPVMSPSCPGLSPIHTPAERSAGHVLVFPSPSPSSVPSPSVQPAVYLWSSSRAANKQRARLSLVLTTEHQKAFCCIGAIVRGFLVRQLLKTEKVKHLRQTILDTQEFIHLFETETAQKRGTSSAQDLSLQERVRAQLRAALYDVHDIFFEMPLMDRLAVLQQDRELRVERKLRDLEKTKCPKERASLSAATQRSLDRKKRAGESPGQVRKVQQKPKSPTTNRVLKPSQGQNSSTPGQLNRQGSCYRKTPEERVRRSDNLKKQHSLG
uniref:Centriolar coiled coil protein 110kDa n=1 Tax=Iconisemion striatum TaxID=60296 RepID=A0A1A7WPW0_9TELE